MKIIYIIFMFFCFFSIKGDASPHYQLINLGLTDYSSSEITSLNQASEVAGTYKDRHQSYVFFCDASKKTNFTNLKISSKPILNNQNEVYGSYWRSENDGLWDFEQEALFQWKNPLNYFTFFNFFNLGFPKDSKRPSPFEQERSVLWDVNDQGQMLIMNNDSIKEMLAYDAPWSFKYRVWFYDKGKYFPIQEPHFYIGIKINNQSEILGYTFEGKDIFDKYEKIATTIYDIKTNTIRRLPFETTNFGKDINDRGQVAGVFVNPSLSIMQGFLNDPIEGTFVFDQFSPVALNNINQLVGKFSGTEKKGKPALWFDNEIYDLSEIVNLTDDKGLTWDSLDALIDINDQGDIIGQGKYRGAVHGFLLKLIYF